MEPSATDRATKAATDQAKSVEAECVWCGWTWAPDLTVDLQAATPAVVCLNPWSCWERRATLWEHRETFGQTTAGLD